eukprot:31938_1
MANVGKLKKGFYGLSIISLLSFFICISIGNAWFLLCIFLPYLIFHGVLSLIISCSHNRLDKQTQYRASVPHSGAWTRRNYLACIGMSSIIHTSIIFSLCQQPYCSSTTFNSNYPYIAYIIIFLIEYFNICLFIDMVIIKLYPGTRNIFYRLFMNWLCCLHFTTCILSVFIAWLFPILALLTRIYNIFPYATCLLYLFVYLFVLTGLYHSLRPTWTYINIQMQQSNDDELDLNEYSVTRCNTTNQNDELDTNNCNSLIICQITDPHIGPLMSVKRLKKLCNEIILKEPDIVLLTGDYFTGEAHVDNFLYNGLLPLKKYSNKCFACLG